MKKQEKKYRGISRIDSHDTHGWFVRAYKSGKTTSKLFSDSIFGGKEQALKKAIMFREDLVQRLQNESRLGNLNASESGKKRLSKTQDPIALAKKAMKDAIAPYSKFKVGAALVCRSGEVYTGHNIESPSYSLTICAERVALFKALSEGSREFKEIVITSNSEDFCFPCGACRQSLMDFAPNIKVTLLNKHGEQKSFKIEKLLPNAFSKSNLKRKSASK